jgi:hypothetical protein
VADRQLAPPAATVVAERREVPDLDEIVGMAHAGISASLTERLLSSTNRCNRKDFLLA